MSSPTQIKSPYAYVQYQSRFNPHAVAVVTQSGGITYEQLALHIERVTRHLHAAGVRAGERVAVHVKAPYLKRAIVMALTRIGAIGVTLSDRALELPLVKPEAIVCDQDPGQTQARVITAGSDWTTAAADALAPFQDVLHDETAPCHIVLSSGTTGRPKMAVVSYGDIRSRMRGTARAYGLNATARLLLTMGANTIAGLIVPITAWANGAAVLIPGAIKTPAHALQMDANVLFLSPSQLHGIVKTLPPNALPLRHLSIYVAGAELPRKLSRETRLRLSPNLFTIYGSTEAGTVAAAHASAADGRPGFTGYVVASALVEIVDAAGNPVPPGTEGEVRIRAEGMVDRYLDDAGSADSPLRDGWLYPGDAGVLDKEGGLSILGRTVEIINVGGVKVSPHAMDEAVAGMRGVVDAGSFGVNTPGGMRACIAVVAGEGFDPDQVAARCVEKLPRLRKPHVVRVDAIPRNDMGKILRGQLAEALRTSVPSA